jgi:excisionase family DNA binding protein
MRLRAENQNEHSTPNPASQPEYEVFMAVLRSINAKLDEIAARLSSTTKPLYTVAEVAGMTGRSAYTARRWISEGKIKAIRIQGSGAKGKLLVPREELSKLIDLGVGEDVPESAIR